MKTYYFQTLKEFQENFLTKEGTFLLLVAEECDFSYTQLQESSLQCYGAIFPEIIYGKNHYKTGLIVVELATKPLCIENIGDTHKIQQYKQELEEKTSLFVAIDGLSDSIDSFLFSLFEVINEECLLFGGGAGKMTLQQENVIFTPDGIYKDAALLVDLKSKISLGVKHGWEQLKGPFVATSSRKNILDKIDYNNAFDTYREVVENDSGVKFTKDNFFELSKSYPLGIITLDNEVIVRDPIMMHDGSLVLVGAMPQNSVISILKGKKENLLLAAKDAAQVALAEQKSPDLIFMVDCISRVLYLEDAFDEEIASVKKITGDRPLLGVLSLGEIANSSKNYIDFYNKTCVVGALCFFNS